MRNLWRKANAAYRWLVGDEDTSVDICVAFALVTFANSIMMVTGNDTPKVGTFAYVHLLLRLTIISAVFLLWDFQGAVADIRGHVERIRAIGKPRRDTLSGPFNTVQRLPFSAACIAYTASIIVVCIATILFVPAPAGGSGLYYGLIWLFVLLCIAAFLVFVNSRAKRHRR